MGPHLHEAVIRKGMYASIFWLMDNGSGLGGVGGAVWRGWHA